MEGEKVARSVAAVVIGYIRWTQIVPMLMAWAFLILGFILYWFVNFQDAGFAGLTMMEQAVMAWNGVEWLPVIEFQEGNGDTGSQPVTWESFQTFVLRAWAGLALVLLVLGRLREAVFGPAPPARLVRKLAVAGVMGLSAWIAFIVTFLMSTEPHNGHPAMWIVMFAVWCVIPVGVSVYSLSVSHVLGLALDRLDELELKPAA